MKKTALLLTLLLAAAFNFNAVFAQAPVISYPAMLALKVDAQVSIPMANSGGAVPNKICFTQTGAYPYIYPYQAVVDSHDNIYARGYYQDGTYRFSKRTPDGTVTNINTLAVGVLGVDGNDNVYIADGATNTVKMLTPALTLSTIPNSGAPGFGTNHRTTMVVDKLGDIYLASVPFDTIVKITPANVRSYIAQKGIALSTCDDANNIYYQSADAAGNASDIMVIKNGVVSTFLPKSAGVPANFVLDKTGNLYYPVDKNIVYRDKQGLVTTIYKDYSYSNDITAFTISQKRDNLLYGTDGGGTDGGGLLWIALTGVFVTPALPQGLVLDGLGNIQGAILAPQASLAYKITARNGYGESTANFTLKADTATNLVTYGTPDFDPKPDFHGVKYTSDNPAVITVVNGKLHTAGVGVASITGTLNGVSQSVYVGVRKARLILKVDDKTTYQGEPTPTYTITYTGFVNGDGPANLTKLPNIDGLNAALLPSGKYGLNLWDAQSSNYAFVYQTGYLTVLPTPSVTYGVADFDPKPSFHGVEYTSSNPAVATVVNGKVHVVGGGRTWITGKLNGNSQAVPLLVNKASLTFTPHDSTMVYSNHLATPIAVGVDITGYVNGEGRGIFGDVLIFGTPNTNFQPGNLPLVVSAEPRMLDLPAASNYNFVFKTGTLTVLQPPAGSGITKTTDKVSPLGHQAEPSVRTLLSPNGDGTNDVLAIDNIASYPKNKLTLINSKGAKVYEGTGYDNVNKAFNGLSNLNGKRQQAGTYFYSLQYDDAGVSKTKTGYFILKYD